MSESFSWWKKRENWHEHSPWVTLQEKCPSQLKFDRFSRWPPANRCSQLIAPPPMGHVTQRRAQNNLRGVLYKSPKGHPIWTQASPSVGLSVNPPLPSPKSECKSMGKVWSIVAPPPMGKESPARTLNDPNPLLDKGWKGHQIQTSGSLMVTRLLH